MSLTNPCVCTDTHVCAWHRPRIEQAEQVRDGMNVQPVGQWDIDAEYALYFGGGT